MNRDEWLQERRSAVELDYTRDAPTYDDYPISELHRTCVERVVENAPLNGVVLDIPCGTGRYFELVTSRGRRVVGADQSRGMVERARALGIADAVELVGLQELDMRDRFHGVMCIDAMEHVPPEDWPRVVANLAGALRPEGLLYMTLEVLRDQAQSIERAYRDALAQGLPVVPGEDVSEETGGHHFYAAPEQVASWLSDAGLVPTFDETELTYGEWGYRHLVLRHSR
jgi:2-polyprenyl-3-methyl-5-hydroxy-6-metoxy-1,4-benzoquinol methylase